MKDDNYREEDEDSLEESPEEMLDEDELSPREEAFLKGYEETDEKEEIDEEDIDKEFE
jgi:hypothetical protein